LNEIRFWYFPQESERMINTVMEIGFEAAELCISPKLDIQTINGKITVFHKDTKKGYVIGENEFRVLNHMDGTNSIEMLSKLSGVYGTDEISQLISAFRSMNFLKGREKGSRKLKDLVRIKIGLVNGNVVFRQDSLLTKLLYILLVYGSIPVFVAGLILYYFQFNGFHMVDMVRLRTIPLYAYIITFWILGFFHEAAHAVVARRYGVSVPDMGIMLYLLIPYAYTNLTFISLLDKKSRKLICLFAGSFSNFLIAGIALLGLAFCPASATGVLLEIAAVNVGIILTNLMVYFKLDGYFILSLLLDENHLRERSMNMVASWIITKRTDIINSVKEPLIKTICKDDDQNELFNYFFGVLSIIYIPVLVLMAIITAVQSISGIIN
jgi:putative peptide zinc metalloprotease protein